MINSINNNVDGLADIVTMDAIIQPASLSPLSIVISTIIITALLLWLYYHLMHGFKGQLRHLKYQLNHSLISPRSAVHKLATLCDNHPLKSAQSDTLKTLRFSPINPSIQQVIEFINHVD